MKRLFLLCLVVTTTLHAFQFQLQWIKTGGPIGGLGYNVRVHPTNKNIMFVTDAWSGVNRSTDGGSTWQLLASGLSTRAVITLAISSDGLYLYAGTKGEGVFRMQTAAVAPPALLSPPNASIKQQLNTLLTWSAVSGADSYRLQVSTSTNFTVTVLDDSTLISPSRQVTSLNLNATYYWRVAAKGLGGYSDWSPTFSFVTIRTTAIERTGVEIPLESGLSQNYPNPFNPSTAISFQRSAT